MAHNSPFRSPFRLARQKDQEAAWHIRWFKEGSGSQPSLRGLEFPGGIDLVLVECAQEFRAGTDKKHRFWRVEIKTCLVDMKTGLSAPKAAQLIWEAVANNLESNSPVLKKPPTMCLRGNGGLVEDMEIDPTKRAPRVSNEVNSITIPRLQMEWHAAKSNSHHQTPAWFAVKGDMPMRSFMATRRLTRKLGLALSLLNGGCPLSLSGEPLPEIVVGAIKKDIAVDLEGMFPHLVAQSLVSHHRFEQTPDAPGVRLEKAI